jgi:hypothetical protein
MRPRRARSAPIVRRGRRPGWLIALAACALAVILALPGAAIAAGDANAASCPNEALTGFSAALPDCRAYEKVSSGFKDGGRPSGSALSADGSRVLEDSLGSFAGVEGNFREATYTQERAASKWVTSSADPAAAVLPAQQSVTAGADLAETLWWGRPPTESAAAENLYVRSSSGVLTELGPALPPAATVGPPAGEYGFFSHRKEIEYRNASRDLSHVLFDLATLAPLWPGDTTEPGSSGRYSLYEYPGAKPSEPQLVGVSDGKTIVNGNVLAAGQLISDCSTRPGSDVNGEPADTYNAMSADGLTVFFTAGGQGLGNCASLSAPEVSELYARRDSSETVAVGEPTKGDCEVCLTPATAAGGRMPAEFAGASEDGSKVFFLTEQELLAGDKGMNLYEYDFANPASSAGNPQGRIVRVSMGSTEPHVEGVSRVSEDGSHVYFVATGVLTGSETNGVGAAAVAGANNLYVFQRDASHPNGALRFVAELSSETAAELTAKEAAACGALTGTEKEECEETLQRQASQKNQRDASDWLARDERPVQATPDGRFLVFSSSADLTAGDTSSLPQIFEYDAANGELVRVSTGAQGYGPGVASANEHSATIPPANFYGSSQAYAATHELAVSGDGAVVAFESGAALTAGAVGAEEAGAVSVYEYRSAGGAAGLGGGNVYLISAGSAAEKREPNRLHGVSPSGNDVLFITSSPVVGGVDGDTQYDVYDARVDGGFPPEAVPLQCAGEGCYGPAAAAPGLGAGGSGSRSALAGGNVPAPGPVSKPPAPSRAQLLARALKQCRRLHTRRRPRRVCEARARRLYAAKKPTVARGGGR